jgi:hypothetical protein
MNINNRNVLKVVAGALLLASLPAGAQVLGGGLGGAVNGTLGGSLGGGGINGAGGIAGDGAFDTSGTFGSLRDRTQQAGSRTHEAAANATSNARSRIDSARGATDATVQSAHSASVNAGRRAADSANTTQQGATQPAATSATPAATQPGGLLLNGSGSASAEKHAMGHTVSAQGSGDSTTSADRSGLFNGTSGQAGASVKKDEPAPAQTPAQ